MDIKTLARVYGWLLLGIMALIVVHAPLTVFFGTLLPEISLLIKAWKEIVMLAAGVIAVILIVKNKRANDFLKQPVIWLCGIFVVLHLIGLVGWQGWQSSLAGLAIDLRFVAYFMLVYILIWLYPAYRNRFLQTATVGAIIVVVFTILQLFLPADFLKHIGYSKNTITPYTTIDQNHDFIRYQSTLRGPNPLGAYAASVSILAAALLINRKRIDWRKGMMLLGSLAATYLSYARSAYIGLVVGVAAVVAVRRWRKTSLIKGLAVLGVVAVLAIMSVMILPRDFVSNVILHEDPEEAGVVNSNDGHWQSLRDSTQRFASQPFGSGVGSTGSASLLGDQPRIIENQYFFIAHEVGWLGLVCFVVLYGVVLCRLWHLKDDPWALGVFGSGVCLAVVGVFLPVWVDDTIAIVWWGMAAVVVAKGSDDGRSSNKKTTRTA